MMKREEADAVPMPMRWVHGETQIHPTEEILSGGSARRAMIVMMRPE